MGLDQGRCPGDRHSKRHTPSASTTDADAASQNTEPQRIGSVHEETVPLKGVETDTSGVNFPRANSDDVANPSMSSSASTAAVSTPVFQSSRLNSSPSKTKPIGAGSSHTLQAERISTESSNSGARPAEIKESNNAKRSTGRSILRISFLIGPPITKATLSDLDVARIIRNAKLRHDINFDPDLHFRPNILGDRGKTKQEHSRAFWRTLTEQLNMFVDENRRSEFMERYAHSDEWCLPLLLQTIKEIVETLVPGQDRSLMEEALNVNLLMQQFYKGMLNLEGMAEWLSGVLKTHCAPMRDGEVNNMLARFRIGSREGNVEQLVMGMCELLSVLEHMKLDLANHYLRWMRPAFITETVHYEQRRVSKEIATCRLDIGRSKLWYRRAQLKYAHESTKGFGDMSIFFRAVARLVRPSRAQEEDAIPPETFHYDKDRLLRIRNDVLDAVNIVICMRVYEHVLRILGKRQGETETNNLYVSLVAILQSTSATIDQAKRWAEAVPHMAVEIFRHAKAPSYMLAMVESALGEVLSNPHDELFVDVEADYHRRLLKDLCNRVREYNGMAATRQVVDQL
ncbi:T-complex protein 11 [Emericellopsis atlantica]|uniref:T-complex protein 11 n=1 Tax=Emericellopsis atlantica TaxID=2614577 RepID=A0A9P7ZC64_9HYPO|nr:T-complex protein 11 [Emericellopsis atlantica]KAG9249399.1 T-complex protein 11 [Emericellopsis atlantica]